MIEEQEERNPTSAPWNICPACNELTDADDIEMSGTEIKCSNCGIRLVAECYGEGDEVEWALIRANEYHDEEVDLETALDAKPYCNTCTGTLGGCDCMRDLVME